MTKFREVYESKPMTFESDEAGSKCERIEGTYTTTPEKNGKWVLRVDGEIVKECRNQEHAENVARRRDKKLLKIIYRDMKKMARELDID